MARRSTRPPHREISTLSQPEVMWRPSPSTIVTNSTPVDDRRTFHPEGRAARPALSSSGRTVKLRVSDYTGPVQKKIVRARVIRGPGGKPMASRPRVVATVFTPRKIKVQTKAKLGFYAPRTVMICVRRKIRKAVMIALKRKPGRGSKQRRNPYSGIKC